MWRIQRDTTASFRQGSMPGEALTGPHCGAICAASGPCAGIESDMSHVVGDGPVNGPVGGLRPRAGSAAGEEPAAALPAPAATGGGRAGPRRAGDGQRRQLGEVLRGHVVRGDADPKGGRRGGTHSPRAGRVGTARRRAGEGGTRGGNGWRSGGRRHLTSLTSMIVSAAPVVAPTVVGGRTGLYRTRHVPDTAYAVPAADAGRPPGPAPPPGAARPARRGGAAAGRPGVIAGAGGAVDGRARERAGARPICPRLSDPVLLQCAAGHRSDLSTKRVRN